MVNVGFVGIGQQGGGMVRRMIAEGLPTTLWARRPEVLDEFPGAARAASLRELGARSEIVGVCVVDDAGVEAVVLGTPDGGAAGDGLLAGMAPGGVIAIHSTVHPATCVRLGETAAARGVTVIDAPVSGGADAAEQGRLVVMVGGDRDVFERALPVLSTYGDPVVHMGPLGSGQLAKLVNNVMFTAHLALAHDAMELAQGLGIDPARLVEVLQRGSAGSFALGIVAQVGSLPAFPTSGSVLLKKDVGIVDGVAAAHGAPAGLLIDVADRALRTMGQPRWQ